MVVFDFFILKDMKMKRGRKIVLKIVIVVMLIILAVNFVLPIEYLPSWALAEIVVVANPVKRRQIRLLCKTDYQSLLESSKEILKLVAKGDIEPGRYYLSGFRSLPVVPEFPQPIMDLAPNYVYIQDGYVKLEMHGGMDHLGVCAYPEDFEMPDPSFKYGNRELIEGLWYYDDGYEDNPRYQKKIDAMLQKKK